MYCSKCGTHNEDTAANCVQCGAPLLDPALAPPQTPIQQAWQPPVAHGYGGAPQPVQIPNYLLQAILVTIFCCLPLGVVAIVFASQVNSKVAVGDIAGAMSASRQAKTFTWISFGIGAAALVIYGAVMILGIAANLARHAR